MSLSLKQLVCTALLAALSAGTAIDGRCAPPPPADKQIKPDVMALIRQSTEAYRKLKSYSADISLKTERTTANGSEVIEGRFVLALDRANRFCYRDMSDPTGTAAVSDGKKLINFKKDRNQFTEGPAPADFKGINIVDDVEFEPLATYVIALMLQGDALADKDIKQGIEKSTVGAPLIENGKKYQVLHMIFGPRDEAYDILFAEDHLITRSSMSVQGNGVKVTVTEQLTNVKADKPIDPAVFLYKPPGNAQKVDNFSAPQRPGDAMITRSTGASLAAYSGPPIRSINAGVRDLIDRAVAAYDRLSSYRHVAVFRAKGTKDGEKKDQSARFSLAMVRPNKLAFKMISTPNVAAVCDGKTFIDYRSREYTQSPAPADFKSLHLDQDDFDPVAGSYLIALLLQDKAYSDPKLLGILLKASAHTGIVADSKTWDALDFPMPGGLDFVIYFDPSTHMVAWAAARVRDSSEDLVLTETYQDIETNKAVADSEFTFTPPASAKKVSKLSSI